MALTIAAAQREQALTIAATYCEARNRLRLCELVGRDIDLLFLAGSAHSLRLFLPGSPGGLCWGSHNLTGFLDARLGGLSKVRVSRRRRVTPQWSSDRFSVAVEFGVNSDLVRPSAPGPTRRGRGALS